jgi:hypothetical protein
MPCREDLPDKLLAVPIERIAVSKWFFSHERLHLHGQLSQQHAKRLLRELLLDGQPKRLCPGASSEFFSYYV